MMRLNALRVANVKRFSSPVAIEGFGPGLNVLSAPNEFGKSTLLAALEAVLFESYSGLNAQTRALEPNSSGAPLVEAEFETNGRQWRIRKQFISGRMASLTDVAAGTTIKNADAEARLAELLAGPPGFDRFGLLWVSQGAALNARDQLVTETFGSGLPALIAAEVDAVALDARGRAIHGKVLKELVELQTKANANPRARWSEAIRAEKETKLTLAAAEAAYQRQEARLVQLAESVAARDKLMAPDAAAQRADVVMAARANLQRATEAKRQRDTAVEKLAAALGALQAAERDHKTLAAALDESQQLQTDATSAAAALAELRERQTAAAVALQTAQEAVMHATSQAAACEALLKAAQAAERAAAAAAARDKLAAGIAEARAAEHAKLRAEADVAGLAATTALAVKALRGVAHALAVMDHELAAVVPEVTIELAPDAAGRITADGRPITAGETLHPDTPLVLYITGIGRITIAPNPATASGDTRTNRDRLRAELLAGLQASGATSLAEAETRLVTRQEAEARLRDANVQLNAWAPQGVAALVAQHATLAAQSIQPASPATIPTVAVAEQQLSAARATRENTAASLRAAETVCAGLRETAAGLAAAAKARLDRMAALHAHYGERAKQDAARAATAAALAGAQAAFTAAQSAADAWAKNPDAAKLSDYTTACDAAEQAMEKAKAEAAALDQRISGLEGELRAASDDELDQQLARAQVTAARAAANLRSVVGEVDALRLLDQEFQAITDAGRTQLSAPILQRVAPYLARLFSDTTLELGREFAPAQLLREGRTEIYDQLSKGTKEQIAILVRLGLGKLLAERGAAVPLVLDDALVYADDRRIAQMFEVLDEAARAHQVIVLNCRAHTFATLAAKPGATALALRAWAPAA